MAIVVGAARRIDPSTFVLRRILPLVLLVTIATGWARWWASRNGHISQTTGVVLMTALAVGLFSGLALWSARTLRKANDRQRRDDRDVLYRLLARNYPGGGVFLFDRDLRYVLTEGQNFDEVGLDGSELEGRTIWEALEPDAAAAIEPAYRAALRGETTMFQMDFRDHTYRVTIVPTLDDDGEIVGGLAQTVDVSQQTQLEEQLRQSQKLEALGQLAGGVAHDFNNLLSVITGYASLVLADTGHDGRLREQVQQIAQASERAAGLTQQLLAFSRQQVLQPKIVDANEIVDELVPMLRRLIESRIELAVHLAADLPPVLFDRGRLEQVLINLVVNARDSIVDAGTVTIETAETTLDAAYVAAHAGAQVGDHVMIAVSDTGGGMDEETQQRIFEPFFTTKPAGSGTGLGLSTVHGIVKQSGGNIWLYSEPGRGATFKIYIPVAEQPDAVERPVAPPPAEVHAVVGARVLVIEDHEALLGLTAKILQAAGYHTETASSLHEGLELLGAHEVDLVLTDLVMPGGSGQQISGRPDVRGMEPPVVYMSGYTEATVTRQGPLAAGVRFLEKPFTPAALLGAVAAALDGVAATR
jgi:signal transduction histidine kinase/ActR/RegA family two-component response regulator